MVWTFLCFAEIDEIESLRLWIKNETLVFRKERRFLLLLSDMYFLQLTDIKELIHTKLAFFE